MSTRFFTRNMQHSARHILQAIQELQQQNERTTRDNLSRITGYNVRTISRSLRALENAGLITRCHRGQYGNEITVNPPD